MLAAQKAEDRCQCCLSSVFGCSRLAASTAARVPAKMAMTAAIAALVDAATATGKTVVVAAAAAAAAAHMDPMHY